MQGETGLERGGSGELARIMPLVPADTGVEDRESFEKLRECMDASIPPR